MPFTERQSSHIDALLSQRDVDPLVRQTVEHLAISDDTTQQDGSNVIAILARSRPNDAGQSDPLKVCGTIFR